MPAKFPAAPKAHPSLPCLATDQAAYINRDFVIVQRSFCGYVGVGYFFHLPDIPVKTFDVLDIDVGNRYSLRSATKSQVSAAMGPIRAAMLARGALPEAVRLIHGILPFDDKELKTMADKLKSKADKASKPAKAAKADKAPKAAKASKAEKAEAGPDTRKITVVQKDNPYREGSKRAESFDALKGAKTVEDYKGAGGAVKYISRWESEGIIKVA